MKIFFKRFFIVFLCVFSFFSILVAVFLLVPTKTEIDEKRLIITSDFATFYDRRNCVFAFASDKNPSTDEFKEEIKKVFVEAEDKNFYSHKGLDYKRILKATFVNLSSLSFKQGASTISQQLIKNTHLSNEKTILRKLKEIKLTQKLEKTYDKETIITAYLNIIYFGENCYGLTKASDYYFNKKPDELTLSEIALLAAIIPSPSKSNPFENPNLAKSKRNRLLKILLERNKITNEEYEAAIKEELPEKKTGIDGPTPYTNAAYKEAVGILGSPYDLRNCRIYTYYDETAQKALEHNALDEYSYQAIAIDNASSGIIGFYSDSGEKEFDPASTVKPFLVYAPAIEENVITPYTLLDDEKRSFQGYEPSNFNDTYYGKVSATTALKKSLNVPAVELFQWTGIEKSKTYANRLGINVKGSNLSAALGSIGGIKISSLAGAYATFANGGRYKKPSFIRKIVSKNGSIIYSDNETSARVFSEGTSSLITKMLIECAKTGTAKKLGCESFEAAAKTGTAGTANGNTDALCVAYTPSHTVAARIAGKNGLLPNDITGGGLPAAAAADVLKTICDGRPFTYKGIVSRMIDRSEYEESGKTLVCPDSVPERYAFEGFFKKDFFPAEVSERLSSPDAEIRIKKNDNKITFILKAEPFITIKIYDENDSVLYSGKKDVTLEIKPGIHSYYYVAENDWGTVGEKKFISSVTAVPPDGNPDYWWED